ncbi:caspase family protein [Corallococcus llansteffanensis]|uniref:Caspase family protein n=1 Tax=Corallococcus llansteffanensis TaxID=2316731 RepID=A0A3A8Q6F6_9BACT|nr:caspase family protein [Corallococcus llansteffanensis]RKH63698.1 caspase family protein [Corallococcus llansteffanensis]
MSHVLNRRTWSWAVATLILGFLGTTHGVHAAPESSAMPRPPTRPVQFGRALVVANRTIPNLEPERNGSILGARMVADSLTLVGLANVRTATDLTAPQLRKLLQERKAEAEVDEEAEVWSLFYYGGHAVQWKGRNYLLMTDFPMGTPAPTDEAAIEKALLEHAVSLQEVINSAPRQSHPNVVIIDACRNNPFASNGMLGKAWSGGFVEEGVAWPKTLVAHSAGPSMRAADPWQTASLYTGALAGLLKLPGATLLGVFPELTHIMRLTSQWPVFISYVSAEDDVLLREPATLLARLAADDEAVLLRNEKLVGMAGRKQPFPVVLEPGDNTFRLLVYNQRSFTGGFEIFGGYRREGWSVGLSMELPGFPDPMITVSETELTPASEARHGRLFDVATFTLHLDPQTGEIQRTEDVRGVWRDVIPSPERHSSAPVQ